jgi:hypothetical protein
VSDPGVIDIGVVRETKGPPKPAVGRLAKNGEPAFIVDEESMVMLAMGKEGHQPFTNFVGTMIGTTYRTDCEDAAAVAYSVRVSWKDGDGRVWSSMIDVDGSDLDKPETWLHFVNDSLVVYGPRSGWMLAQAMRALKDDYRPTVEMLHTGWVGDTFAMPSGTVMGAEPIEVRGQRYSPGSVSVTGLSRPWSKYSFREAEDEAEARDACEAVRDLFSDLDLVVVAPLVAYNVVSVLGEADLCPVLLAKYSSGKTPTATILSLRFFGKSAEMSGWGDTAKAAVESLHAPKDVVTVMDDLVADGHRKMEDLKEKMEGVVRGVSGQAGRKRLAGKGTYAVLSGREPRGGVVITAEHIPPIKASLMARCVVVECPRIADAPNPHRWKDDAPETPVVLLEVFTHGFIRWLQGQRKERRLQMREWADTFKEETGPVQSARVKENAAHLWSGLCLLAVYLEEAGVPLDPIVQLQCRAALEDIMVENDERIAAERSSSASMPALLQEMLAAGKVHLRGPRRRPDERGNIDPHTNAPEDPESWGWTRRSPGVYEPRGEEIGLVYPPDASGERLMRLYPKATLTAVARFAKGTSVNLAGDIGEIWKHLLAEGRVKPGHKGRGHGGAGKSVALGDDSNVKTPVIETTVRMFFAEEVAGEPVAESVPEGSADLEPQH